MSLDAPVRLLEVVDTATLADLCRRFADAFGLGLRIYDGAGGQVAEVSRDAGLAEWIFSQPEARRPFTEFVTGLKGVALDPGEDAVLDDPVTGARWLVAPVAHEFDVLGSLVCGPYLPPDAVDALPWGHRFGEGEVGEALAARRAALPRVDEVTLRARLHLLLGSLDAVCHAGLKALLTSKVHLDSITEAYNELQAANARLAEVNAGLASQNARLRELDDIKSNFIATVSHELRTPLTAVIGYGEMLLEELAGPITPEQREYLSHIVGRGSDLMNLIGGILDLARIEKGAQAIQRTPSDVGAIVHDALGSVNPQAHAAQVRLVSRVPNLPRLALDADKLRQVLVNLLGNAIKFTPAGGQVTVSAMVGRHAEVDIEPALVLSVADTGVGIPAHEHARVFEAFYQVDNSSTRAFGGTGLGLSIVKNFVHMHGGVVLLESAEGRGSTFVVVLPAQAP